MSNDTKYANFLSQFVEDADLVHEARSSRSSLSRCSLRRMHSFIEEISKGNELREQLSTSPFGYLFRGSFVRLGSYLEYIVNIWKAER